MPIYEFSHAESGDTFSLHVPLNAPDSARREQIVDGKVYKRVYSAPSAAHDTAVRDMTSADFKRVTEGKNVKVGDLWKIAGEMSNGRADREGGIDPVKEQFYAKHEKETGKPHQDVIKRNAQKAQEAIFKQMGIRVE